MKRQKLIENLENILNQLKTGDKDDNIVIWAYDQDGFDGTWITLDGNFEIDEKQHLNII